MFWFSSVLWTTFVQAAVALFGVPLEDTGCRLLGRTFESPQVFHELPDHCLMVSCLGVYTGLRPLPSCQCLAKGEKRRPPSSERDWGSEITLQYVQDSHRIGNLKYDVSDWSTANTNWHGTPDSVHGVDTTDPEWVETFEAGTKDWSIMSGAEKGNLEDLEHYIKIQGQGTHSHDMVASNEEYKSNREAGRDIVRAKNSLYKFWDNSEQLNSHLGRYGSRAQSLVRHSVSQSRNGSSTTSKSSKVLEKITAPQVSWLSKESWVDGNDQIDEDATFEYLGQLLPPPLHGSLGKLSVEERLPRARRMTSAGNDNSGWVCALKGTGMTKILVEHCLMVECFNGSGGGQILRPLPDCTCTRTEAAVDKYEENEFVVGVIVDERNMRQQVFSLENISPSFETFQQIVQRNSDEILKYESLIDTSNTTRKVSEHALEMRRGENIEKQSNKTKGISQSGSSNEERSSVLVGREESEYITFNETAKHFVDIWSTWLGYGTNAISDISVTTFNDSYRKEEVNLKSENFPKTSTSISTTLSNVTASLEPTTQLTSEGDWLKTSMSSSSLPSNESTDDILLSTVNLSSSVDQEATTLFSEFRDLFIPTTSSSLMKTSEYDRLKSTKSLQTADDNSQHTQKNPGIDHSSSSPKVEDVIPPRSKPVSILFSGRFNKWTNDRLLTQNKIMSSQIQETSRHQAVSVTTKSPVSFKPSIPDHTISSNEMSTPSMKNRFEGNDLTVSSKAIALNTAAVKVGSNSRDPQSFRRIVLSLPLNSPDGAANFGNADLVELPTSFTDSRLTLVRDVTNNTSQNDHNNHAQLGYANPRSLYNNNHSEQNKHTHIELNMQEHDQSHTHLSPNIDYFIGLNIQKPSPNDSQVGQRVHGSLQTSNNRHTPVDIQSVQRLHVPFAMDIPNQVSNVSQSNLSVHSHIGLNNQRETINDSEMYQTSDGQIGLDKQNRLDNDRKTYKSLHSHIGLKNERSSYNVGHNFHNFSSFIGQNYQGQSYNDSQRRRMQQNNGEIEKMNQSFPNVNGQDIPTIPLWNPGNILAAAPYWKSILNPMNHIIYFNAASYEEKVANSASAFSGKDGQ